MKILTSIARCCTALAFAASALMATGCVGINDNSSMFLNPPEEHMLEVDVIRKFGAPQYSGFAEDKKIYVYKVRNHKYIVLLGIYEGYDLVVVCEGGEVSDVVKVTRPSTFAFLQPAPWAEGID